MQWTELIQLDLLRKELSTTSGFTLEMQPFWGKDIFWFIAFNHIALNAKLECIHNTSYGVKNKHSKLQVLGVRLPWEKYNI